MKLEMKTPIAVFNLESTALRPSRVRELSGMTREALIRLAAEGSNDPERTERLVQGHHPGGLYHFATVPLPSLDAEWKGDGCFRAVAVTGYGITGEEDLRFFEDLTARLDGEKLRDSVQGEIRTSRTGRRLLNMPAPKITPPILSMNECCLSSFSI